MIPVGRNDLSLDDFSDLLFKRQAIVLDGSALEKVDANFRFLQDFSAGKLIYGINTGFGPMAQYKVENENLCSFNIILSAAIAQAAGAFYPFPLVRALMIARLNSLMQAYSGVHTDTVEC